MLTSIFYVSFLSNSSLIIFSLMTMQIYMLYNMFCKYFKLHLPYMPLFNFFTYIKNGRIYLYINMINQNV